MREPRTAATRDCLPLLTLALAAGVAGGCFSGGRMHGEGASGGRSATGGQSGGDGAGGRATATTPEAAWLERVGTGPAQTARVCARGPADPVARALCAKPAPALGGLTNLYSALHLTAPGTERLVAAATHSVGLSTRTVSPMNPRTFVFRGFSPLDIQNIAATAFSRGEPFVELVGYDTVAHDFNFYLLSFQPTCEAAACTPLELLTASVESGWTGWTLYGDTNLEDTGFDCTSCHRPDGPSAPRRLLMRQFFGPWMHWGDFRGVTGRVTCDDQTGVPVQVTANIPASGLDVLARVEGASGSSVHAGIPLTELTKAASGYDFSSFLFYTAGLVDGVGDVPCEPPDCPFIEPHPFDSESVLCDQALHGAGDLAGGTWALYRAEGLGRGLPVPYFGPDVLNAARAADAMADWPGYLRARATLPAFQVAAELLDPAAMRAVGVISGDDDDAPAMLRQMCVRCHNATTPAALARARFRADDLAHLDAAGAAKIIDRISQSQTSPDLMPPLRAGELSAASIARLTDYLQRLQQ